MRVLLTTQPFLGHFYPLVPLARALEREGHQVMFLGRGWFLPEITSLGFMARAVGGEWDEAEQRRTNAILETLPEDPRAHHDLVEEFVGRRTGAAVQDILDICGAWMPDLIVHEQWEFAGSIASSVLGLPSVRLDVAGLRRHPHIDPLIYLHLGHLRKQWGLSSRLDPSVLYGDVSLSFTPPSFDDLDTLPAGLHVERLKFEDGGVRDDEELPTWAHQPLPGPVIFISMGTVFNGTLGVMETALREAESVEGTVIAVVGRNRDPDEFGPQPGHVILERYLPYSRILPRCDLAVTHGGRHAVLSCIRHEVPMVVVPLAFDQPFNAERCQATGVGTVLLARELTAGRLSRAIAAVLADPSYARHSREMSLEMQSLPSVEHGVRLLESLVDQSRRAGAAI